MKNKTKYIFVIASILLVLLIVGCSQNNSYDNKKSNQIETENIDYQKNIATPNNKETDLTNSNYCLNVDNEVWQKRCQAYKDANPDLCKSFDNGNPSGKDDIDECYHILSKNTDENNCAKIEDKKLRWKCEAIATKDMNQCAYSIDLESEIWCLRNYMQFYQDKEACDLIGQKEQKIKNAGLIDGEGNVKFGLSKDDCLNSLELIQINSEERNEESQKEICYQYDCSIYNGVDCSSQDENWKMNDCYRWQAVKNKDYKSCLLIKENVGKRDICLTEVAHETGDISICYEMSNNKNSCIGNLATNVDITFCNQHSDTNNCIITAVQEMDEANQQINPKICSSIKDANKQGLCYVEYAKSEVEMH